ncbi:M16 family metallopeptidase [Oceanicella actignis]|uniref:M16 family metallopeptidase n=1 Tax=Oceanicella actignis TaxID=1189325 RepID=UPI0011E678FB|nr:pitrilysin family protein [Oceanicella actignis]TYO88161.1 zinc protease [Oceanicella actignis]
MIRLCLAALGALAFLAAAPAPVRAAAEVQEVVSPGGIRAWLVREPALPMVAFEIIFEGGALRDPDGLPGAANFLAAMLSEGAGDLDAAAFARKAETLALRAGFSAGRDSFTVSARMLTENLDESVDLLRLALTEPRFDPDAVERVRAGILSGLRSARTDPDSLAAMAWSAAMFPGDPYGRPVEGDEAAVARIGPEDLRAARLRALNRSRLAVGVVGDIDAQTLGPLLDRLLGALPDDPWTPPPPARPARQRGTTVVPLDTPQSRAVLGHEGLLRSDPDFIPAYVMNHILGGGGFSSRLMREVREKRGLTYGVYSYLAPYRRAGLIMAGLASDNARMAEALEVIRAEWARMAREGATAEELEAAKRYLTGAYPLRFDTNAKIAGQLAGLMREGFDPGYLRRRNALIEAVTLDDIRRVAARLLHPERLRTVVVGRPEGLPPGPPIPGFTDAER